MSWIIVSLTQLEANLTSFLCGRSVSWLGPVGSDQTSGQCPWGHAASWWLARHPTGKAISLCLFGKGCGKYFLPQFKVEWRSKALFTAWIDLIILCSWCLAFNRGLTFISCPSVLQNIPFVVQGLQIQIVFICSRNKNKITTLSPLLLLLLAVVQVSQIITWALMCAVTLNRFKKINKRFSFSGLLLFFTRVWTVRLCTIWLSDCFVGMIGTLQTAGTAWYASSCLCGHLCFRPRFCFCYELGIPPSPPVSVGRKIRQTVSLLDVEMHAGVRASLS